MNLLKHRKKFLQPIFIHNVHLRSLYKVIFYGSDQFSLETLKMLRRNFLLRENDSQKKVSQLHVCTMSEKNLVSKYSKKNCLKLHNWPYEFDKGEYDLGVVVSFGKLIPQQAIDNCNKGILNVHASLLPQLRGAAPIHRAILQGLNKTGVTVMRIVPNKFDIGDIILQDELPLDDHTKTTDIYHKMASMGAELLMKCLYDLDFYLTNAKSQDKALVSFAPKIKEDECEINWKKDTRSLIYRKYRAFGDHYPLRTRWLNNELLLLHEMIDPEAIDQLRIDEVIIKFTSYSLDQIKPGFIFFLKQKKILCIRCVDGYWVGFQNVNLKNYNLMPAIDFNNGFLSKVNHKNTVPVYLN